MLPLDGVLLKQPQFVADRAALLGFDFKAGVAKKQPGAISETLSVFEFLETTLLSDGRKWLLNTDAPTTIDIEAVWQIVWLDEFETAFPAAYFSRDKFPNMRRWVDRFNHVVKEAEQTIGPIVEVTGDEAEKIIRAGDLHEESVSFDKNDPLLKSLGLAKGDTVTI